MIAFLGMGHLGANFVRAMLRRGEQVQVWNRTASKAKALEAEGAKAFDDAADAVRGVQRIHLCLKDDESVNEILSRIEPALQPGAIIIDHTTTTATGAIERTAAWKQKGFAYLHAPVFMGPQNALESTAYMVVSGDRDVLGRVEEELKKMTGTLMYFGPEEGKAAGIKLLGNLFLIAMSGGLADMLSLAHVLDINKDEMLRLLDIWNTGAMAIARLKRMTSGNYSEPSWELDMSRKDAGLMMQEAKNGDRELAVIPGVAALMDKFIAKGHGKDDWTVIGKVTD